MIFPRVIPAPWAAALAWLCASVVAFAMAEARATAPAPAIAACPVAVRPSGLPAEQHHTGEGAAGAPLPRSTAPVAGPARPAGPAVPEATPPPEREDVATVTELA